MKEIYRLLLLHELKTYKVLVVVFEWRRLYPRKFLKEVFDKRHLSFGVYHLI